MVWLYLTAACAVAPIVPELPWWLNLVFTLCIGWRYASDHRGWIRPGRLLRLLLLVLIVVVVYRQYGTILRTQRRHSAAGGAARPRCLNCETRAIIC